jgi:hypothetical protein
MRAGANEFTIVNQVVHQQMVASFSRQSGMDLNWSLKCLMDSGWVYDSAAYRFNLLKRTFKIPLAAFMKPEQQQQQMIASFSEQSGMDSNWSFKCLEDCGWDHDVTRRNKLDVDD